MIEPSPKASRSPRKLSPALLLVAALGCPAAGLAQAAPQTSTPRTTPSGSTAPKASPTKPSPRNTAPAINRNLVVLDPAHGGPDTGARLTDQATEKDVTLALATRLRPALAAAGFTVVSTRDAELQTALTTDQRAELANSRHAAACLILHATSAGSGVHLYISGVQPTPAPVDPDPDVKPAFEPTSWDMAQAGSALQSLHLQSQILSSLASSSLPAIRGRGPVRPLDNLLCPAVAIEIAPLTGSGGSSTPVTDATYQQRLVDSLTAALVHWRDSLPARQKPVPPPANHPPAAAGAPQ